MPALIPKLPVSDAGISLNWLAIITMHPFFHLLEMISMINLRAMKEEGRLVPVRITSL